MSAKTFAQAYGMTHRHPQALHDALYGLPELYRQHLSHTRLVALVHASNVTGGIQPIAEVGDICRRKGVPLLVDAAQTAGVIAV